MDDAEDNEDWQEPIEESEVQPSEQYSNTGVACRECGAVNPMKRHFARGVFSYECPVCRRKQSNKTAQKKRRVNEAKAASAADAALFKAYKATVKSINTRVNNLTAKSKQQEERLRASMATKGITGRSQRALVRRTAQIKYYEQVRERMLADATKNQLKPIEHYLQDETLYANYLTATNKPTTAESGAYGADESEGMEEGA